MASEKRAQMRLTKQQKALYQAIRVILRNIWDPIAANVPDDEYDSYALQVLGKLIHGATIEEIREYLWSVQSDVISQKLDDNRCQVVAELLVFVKNKCDEATWL